MNSVYALISSCKKHELRIDGKYSNYRSCWHVGIAKFEISDANYLLGYEIASLFRSMPELCTWGMRALWAWLPPAGLEPFFSRSWACARPTAPWNFHHFLQPADARGEECGEKRLRFRPSLLNTGAYSELIFHKNYIFGKRMPRSISLCGFGCLVLPFIRVAVPQMREKR